jgi:hypothetical protein
MQSGSGGLGRCRSANLHLAALPEIDRRSKHHLVAGLDAVADLLEQFWGHSVGLERRSPLAA